MAITLSADDHLDDLPRTLRKRSVRSEPDRVADDGEGVVVRALKVPFWRLVFFLIKCVLAGIPALALLIAILWGAGELLEIYYPDLIKAKVVIQLAPNG
jgi:hypothetical protein